MNTGVGCHFLFQGIKPGSPTLHEDSLPSESPQVFPFLESWSSFLLYHMLWNQPPFNDNTHRAFDIRFSYLSWWPRPQRSSPWERFSFAKANTNCAPQVIAHENQGSQWIIFSKYRHIVLKSLSSPTFFLKNYLSKCIDHSVEPDLSKHLVSVFAKLARRIHWGAWFKDTNSSLPPSLIQGRGLLM